MVPRRSSTAVLLGLVVSLVLHASILLPGLVKVMSGEVTPMRLLRADFEPEDFMTTEIEPNQVELGIDDSTVSTMTWIGFEDYQEHLAAIAEVEQAAFQTTPTGSEPVPASPTDTPIDTVQDETDTQTPPVSPPSPDPEEDPSTSPDPFEELEAWFDAAEGVGPAIGEPTSPDTRSQALDDIIERLQQMMENTVETEQPEQTPKPAQQPTPPEPAPSQPQPAGEPGVQSDQESDASSIVEVTMEQLTLGRPLAAQGLQLKPRKPVFTTLTLLTAVPANPRAELRFRRDGKPVRVRLLESSGDPRIDEAVLSSLYRWRAAGKKLRELERNETIPVQIRIILRRR